MMEDTGELTMALNAALVARSIERIGDHAKSISGYVIYVMEGREGRNV
jgi:phosphate transport system protein